MPFKSNFWNMIISILWPYFWRSNDKLRFILNAITIYSIINYVGFVVMIIGFCILYFMASNNLGPFYVGVDQSWRPVCRITVYCGNHTYGDGFIPVCGRNVVCQGGDHRYDGRHG